MVKNGLSACFWCSRSNLALNKTDLVLIVDFRIDQAGCLNHNFRTIV